MAVDYIFLFSLNNSGTTIMSRYLAQQTGGYLPPYGNNEGQMAPAVFRVLQAAREDLARTVDWGFVHGEWDRLARRAGKGLFIEGSPSTYLWAGEVLAAFGPGTRAVFSAANPYGFIASVLYNYHYGALTDAKLRRVARRWVRKALLWRAAVEANPQVARVSYEAFCADPGVLNRALGLELRPVDPALSGKGPAGGAGIVDQTRRQLAFLSAREWDVVNEVFAEQAELVRFFGYEVTPGAGLIAEAERDPKQAAAGRARRAGWGPRWKAMGLRATLERGSIRVRAALIGLVRRPEGARD